MRPEPAGGRSLLRGTLWTSPVRAEPPEHRCVGCDPWQAARPPGDSPSTRTTLESCSTELPQAACTVTRTSPAPAKRVVTQWSRDSKGCRGTAESGRAGAGPLAGAAARRQGMGQRGAWGGPRRSRVEADAAWTPVFQRLPPAPPLWMVQEAYVASGWASTHRPCPSEAWLAQHPACGAGRIYLVAGLPQTIQMGAEALGAQLQVSTLRAEGTAQACARPARGPPLGPYSPSPPGLRVWALRHCLGGFLLGGTGLKFAE